MPSPIVDLALRTLGAAPEAGDDLPALGWRLALHLGPDGSHPACVTATEANFARGLCLALGRDDAKRAEACAANVNDPEGAMARGLDTLWRLTKGAAGQPMFAPSKADAVAAGVSL